MIVSRCVYSILLFFVGLICLFQSFVGISCLFIQSDLIVLNKIIEIDRFEISFLYDILRCFIVLGSISTIFAFASIFSQHQRLFVGFFWIFILTSNVILLILSIVYQTLILPKFDQSLIRLLNEFPLKASNFLDFFQEKYSCCGIGSKIDYKNLPLDPFPSSCCRVPNCWRDSDSNDNFSLIHSIGCFSSMEKFLRIELIVLISVASFCSFFDLIIVILTFSMKKNVETKSS